MSKAIIYQPCKSAMQSGTNKSRCWYLEYASAERHIDPIMGWTSSADTSSQLKLKFATLQEAEEYAKLKQLSYDIMMPNQKRYKSSRPYTKNYQ
jgi:hypothetical protein